MKKVFHRLFAGNNNSFMGRNRSGFISLMIAVSFIGCSPSDSSKEAFEEDSAVTPMEVIASIAGAKVVNAEIVTISPTTFVQHVKVVGAAEASKDVIVSAEETGVITTFLVRKGENLVSGQPIARIESTLLNAQVEEAEALSDVANERFDRQRRLWEKQRIGTEISLLEAKSQAISSVARLKILETRLAKTIITSPLDGVLDRSFVEIGELVVPGTKVFQVLVNDPVKIVAGIPERYALSVVPGTDAIVTFDVITDREYAGTIDFVGASVDPRSRTIPIEIVIPNSEKLIRPFMVANVQVERIRQEQVIVVSQDLVQRTEEGFQIFIAEVRNDDLIARARDVELGSSYSNEVVITRGLVHGDKLITAGHRQVDDGSLIRIVQKSLNEHEQ